MLDIGAMHSETTDCRAAESGFALNVVPSWREKLSFISGHVSFP
jgi:hypothetical protein